MGRKFTASLAYKNMPVQKIISVITGISRIRKVCRAGLLSKRFLKKASNVFYEEKLFCVSRLKFLGKIFK